MLRSVTWYALKDLSDCRRSGLSPHRNPGDLIDKRRNREGYQVAREREVQAFRSGSRM